MSEERAALPQQGDTIAEKYRIERTIGAGGMSVVYGATHVITSKRFAIKWLMPVPDAERHEAKQRFIREAQVAGRFQHPNVVEVYDVGQVGDAHYMIMEWLEGESLAARLERVGPLAFEQACEYLIPCMRAIDEAHASGIVHRDLKPANIFLCRATKHAPEKAKVLDFGIAKMDAGSGPFNPFVTRTGTLIGTPYYLAPEQLRNLPADARTDVYAFGVMLYQVLSGELPFDGNNFGELVVQIATGTPRRLAELGVALDVEAVVERAMARNALERYQNIGELVAALEPLRTLPAPALQPRLSNSQVTPVWPLESSLATESVAERSHRDMVEAMRAHDLRDWSRWGLVVMTLLVIAGAVRWYAHHGQETAVRAAASAPIDIAVTSRTAATSALPPSAARPESAGAAAVQLPLEVAPELPRGLEAPAPRARPAQVAPRAALPSQAEPAAALPVAPATPKPARRPKPRATPPVEAPVVPLVVQPDEEPEDDNPLHMKIQ
jgi:serine/threonine-protein kinase